MYWYRVQSGCVIAGRRAILQSTYPDSLPLLYFRLYSDRQVLPVYRLPFTERNSPNLIPFLNLKCNFVVLLIDSWV